MKENVPAVVASRGHNHQCPLYGLRHLATGDPCQLSDFLLSLIYMLELIDFVFKLKIHILFLEYLEHFFFPLPSLLFSAVK